MKKPEIGDTISHYLPYSNKTYKGTVTQILSSQFVYKTDTGNTRFCLFKEDWSYVDGK